MSKKLLYIFLLIFISCSNKQEKKEIKNDSLASSSSQFNLNISIFMDLSDRIDTLKYPNSTMQYYQRDIAYIESISNVFDKHLRSKRVRQMDDKIQIFFDPEPENSSINTISNNLKFHITKSNVTMDFLDEIRNNYASKPKEIYNLALKDGKFIGSDIWGFFRNKVKDFCIEENHRNILIILTDGYIYHQNSKREDESLTTYLTPQIIRKYNLNTTNWKEQIDQKKYGFIPATNDLKELEVLVLGINADKSNPYEEDVIKKYWSDWLDAMEVNYYEIWPSELPSNMERIIFRFFHREP